MTYILFYACAIRHFIPHRVAPPQSSAVLQTAGTNIMRSIDLNKEKDKILSLQFDLYAQNLRVSENDEWLLPNFHDFSIVISFSLSNLD